jgi:hypothetical protein
MQAPVDFVVPQLLFVAQLHPFFDEILLSLVRERTDGKIVEDAAAATAGAAGLSVLDKETKPRQSGASG